MEILGEFDNECPLYISFCRRISPEDFERQALIHTRESLRDLFAAIDRDPGICEPIARKKKRQEEEEAGFASYIKAKVSSFFRRAAPVRMEEVCEEAERLKREMRKASNYALDVFSVAKRAPLWPPERRESTTRMHSGQSRMTAMTIPPMPKIFGPYPAQAERHAVDAGSKLPQPGLFTVNQKSMVDHHPLMLNPGGRHPSFLGGNSAHWWKGSHLPRATASLPTKPLQNGSPPGSALDLNPLAPSGPRTGEEEEREEVEEDGSQNGSLGCDSHAPAA